jgi:hypothetical protein
MRTPSIKSLSAVFDDPKQAKTIFRMTRAQLKETEAGARRYREGGASLPTYAIRLEVLNALEAGLHGVEAIQFGADQMDCEYAEYLNTGDSYAATVIYWRGRYRVQDIGTFVETMERRSIRAN